MIQRLQLRYLDLGKTDSKNELIHNSDIEKKKFRDSFLLPENIDMSKFLDDKFFEYYFIKGLKGTGKTCLLRFIGLEIDRKPHSYSSFILFKSGLKNYKSELAKAAIRISSVNSVDTNNDDAVDEELDDEGIDLNELRFSKVVDYGILWDWIIHKQIVDTIEKEQINVFKKNINWENYSICVKAITNLMKEKEQIIPTIKHGNIEISAGFREIAKVKLNLNVSPSAKTIRFEELITKINRLFTSLTKDKDNLYILFDELELTPIPRKAYKRDVALIRDLISSIGWFNAFAQSTNGSVFLIAAIRTEVINAVEALGKENNKLTDDFGIEISWKNTTRQTVDHPLLKMLEKRFKAAEKHYGYSEKQITTDVWEDYFEKKIDDTDIRKCIISHTWYKPRDIIRLLLCAKNEFPYERQISQNVFENIKKDYSEQSWKELCEELRLLYNVEELSLIKNIFGEFKREFTYNEIREHVDNLKNTRKTYERFFEKHSIENFLEDLYRVGAIGNVYIRHGKRHFGFIYNRGNSILYNQSIIIHKGLLPCFFIEEFDTQYLEN